jgi:2-polyprenyl-6-methoxyphenol hydroxylase-like FAD-dependent oxidoreductase
MAQPILIVGGGIGGLTLAIALAKRGVAADVIELHGRVTGVGITLRSSTLLAMQAIDLAAACVDRGFGFDTTAISDGAGKLQTTRPVPTVPGAEDLPGNAGITRPALSELLTETAVGLGASIRYGLSVDRLTQDDGGVDVTFTDGSEARYDLLVGADGTYSRIRELLLGPAYTPEYAGQGVWRFLTERHPFIDHLHIYVGPHRRAGFIPLSDRLMYLFCTVGYPEKPWFDEDTAHEYLRAEIADFTAPVVAEIRDRLTGPEGVIWRPFETLFVPSPWYKGRVVLIGDAVHSMTPHLTAGGGMAIEDAVVLAEMLTESQPIDKLLAGFMARRFERVQRIHDVSLAVSRLERQDVPDPVQHRAMAEEGHRLVAQPF